MDSLTPMGIAAWYWILAMALGFLGMLMIFAASDGLIRQRGDLAALVFAFFFGAAGLGLLYISLNGFWDFARGSTDTLDVLIVGWIRLARVMDMTLGSL